MVKISVGQSQFDFAADLKRLLEVGPDHLNMMEVGSGGFSWWHHLSALMIVACFSDLEAALEKSSWHKYHVHEEEFEVLRHIRNAYVHTASDLAKIRESKKGLPRVQGFLAKLAAGKVTGIKGKNQVIEPYFQLSGSVVQLQEQTIPRMRSLYLQLMMTAGKIQK